MVYQIHVDSVLTYPIISKTTTFFEDPCLLRGWITEESYMEQVNQKVCRIWHYHKAVSNRDICSSLVMSLWGEQRHFSLIFAAHGTTCPPPLNMITVSKSGGCRDWDNIKSLRRSLTSTHGRLQLYLLSLHVSSVIWVTIKCNHHGRE